MEVVGQKAHLSIPVLESSQVGSLRRLVREMSFNVGFTAEAVGRAEIVATELATNLVKHTDRGGQVLVRSLVSHNVQGIELIALDKGPGMADVVRALQDGVSTAGTLGSGLGAVKRLSSEFDIHSRIGKGTAVLSRLWSSRSRCPAYGWVLGGVRLAMPGQDVCGDDWAAVEEPNRVIILLVDGLGHGPKAALAAQEAIRVFKECSARSPGAIVQNLHNALRHTQGAALAVAEIDLSQGRVIYSGIGNIAGRVVSSNEVRGCVSTAGVAGFQLHKVQEFTYPWSKGSMLLMNSDGFVSSVNVQGLGHHASALVAGLLFRDFARGTDDATIVVVRNKPEGEY